MPHVHAFVDAAEGSWPPAVHRAMQYGARPSRVAEYRTQGAPGQSPLAKADDWLHEVRRTPSGGCGRAHRAGTGSGSGRGSPRCGGASRRCGRRSGATPGTTGGAAETRIGSTVMVREGPGSDPTIQRRPTARFCSADAAVDDERRSHRASVVFTLGGHRGNRRATSRFGPQRAAANAVGPTPAGLGPTTEALRHMLEQAGASGSGHPRSRRAVAPTTDQSAAKR
jgi:hypothetical protein